MRADDIRVGDVLKLKLGIYGPEYELVQVASVRTRANYKTPWLFNANGEAFKPQDFARRARQDEIDRIADALLTSRFG